MVMYLLGFRYSSLKGRTEKQGFGPSAVTDSFPFFSSLHFTLSALLLKSEYSIWEEGELSTGTSRFTERQKLFYVV